METTMHRRTGRVALAALLTAAALISAPATAQVEDVEELSFPPLPEMEIPQPERIMLDNGMVVLLLEDHELPLVEATARIHTGARLEPADKVGLAELTGTVLRTGGTRSRTGDELDDFLEARAASIETSIGTSSGQASMSSLKKDFPEVLEVFAEVLREPVFAEDKLTVAKTQIEASIARQNDNPQQIVFREGRELLRGEDSPLARSPTYESVGNISRDDLVAWHEKYFHPNRIILGLVGDFDTEEVITRVREAFGDWERGPDFEPPAVPYDEEPKPGVFFAEKNDMTQAAIAMGHLGIRRDNPDYFAVEVMNQAMSGSFASRFFSNIRSKKGLAYTVFGNVGSSWDIKGLTLLYMSTATENTGAGIEALLEEARGMTERPLSDEEVAKAKQGILNSFVFNSDSTGEILGQQLTYEYYGYPLDWLSRYRQGIEEVTTAEARAAAEKYLHPEHLSILVVGPEKVRDEHLSKLGEVTEIDISIPEPPTEKAEVSEEGAARARELIAKAVEGLGGAEMVDELESFYTSGVAVRDTPAGEMEIQVATTYLFPDRFRQELTLPMGTVSMVIGPDVAYAETPQGRQEMPGSQRKTTEATFRRNILSLLKARNDPEFEVTTLGAETVGETEVELVQIDHAGDVTVLGIEPDTGYPILVRFQGPGGSGSFGEVTQVYSDFRQVEGMTYPFSLVSSFEGEENLTFTIQEIERDREVDEEIFEAPASGPGG